MNKQEMFDKVLARARANPTRSLGQRRMSSAEQCFYRGYNGNTCFIGCLIPDELYNSDMEGRNVMQLREYSNEVKELLEEADPYFLMQLQAIHDYAEPKRWEKRLSILANDFKLKYEPLS